MVKECPVIMNNDYVSVVKFGDTVVQLPSIKGNEKCVRVANENGKYFLVDSSYADTTLCLDRSKKRKNAKKTMDNCVSISDSTGEEKVQICETCETE